MRNPKEAKPLEYYLELNYPITIHRAEEGGFVAEIEDLRGCLTQGETIEEAIENIEEARQLWIRAAYEDGVEIPIPRTDEEYSGRFLVRMPKSLHRRLADQARYECVSLNQLVESMLSAGEAVQSVLGEMKTELDKISKQVYTHRIYTYGFPTPQPHVVIEEAEQESYVKESAKIKDKEVIAA